MSAPGQSRKTFGKGGGGVPPGLGGGTWPPKGTARARAMTASAAAALRLGFFVAFIGSLLDR